MADRWTDADRELVAGVLHQEGCEDPCPGNCAADAAAVLHALADAGKLRANAAADIRSHMLGLRLYPDAYVAGMRRAAEIAEGATDA